MNNEYISYYFRNLCVETFPSYGTDIYYDMCVYEHFFELLLRSTNSNRDFNIFIFIDKYLNKLESDKYVKKFKNLSKIDYDDAKSDFFKLLSNIFQITLIYNYRNSLPSLKEELLNLDDDRKEKFRCFYNLGEMTMNLIDNALLEVKNALLSKIEFEYDMKTYDSVLSATLSAVEEKLENLKIEDIVSENSVEIDANQQKIFKKSKEEVIERFEIFIAAIQDTFYNNRKIRHLQNVKYYLSFLLHDKIIPLDALENMSGYNRKAPKKVFKNLYGALYYAYKMSIYFIYFKDKYEKATLKEILAFFDNESLKVGIGENYIDRRLEHIFFNIVNNLNVRRDFKHLPLIILGYQLSLDAKTIEKISVQLDYESFIHNNNNNDDDDDYIIKDKKNKTKNPNVTSRFKDLKYTTNAQMVYDLDEDIGEFLELFNSYKIEAIYEANIVDEDGEFKTLTFNSKDDYKKYSSPYCDENEIEDMIHNYLRKKDKKVYYEPLFEIDF